MTGGTTNQLTEDQLVEEIKRLAVAKVNIAVHVKEFLEMRQDTEEPVRQFKARLPGKSLSCDFRVAVEVTCEGCQETKTVRASYVDEMVKYKIVTGLDDLDIMQDVLAADKKRLDEVVTFIEGKESGKKGQKYLAGGAAVSKVSQIPPSTSGGGGEKCKYCNRIGHGASPSEITRKASCPVKILE